MIITILTFIVVLSILVFAHELGHFWVARWFGLKPKEFGFGFPPRALGFYKDVNGKWKRTNGGQEVTDASDTIYSINWLPLGGFVNLDEDEEGGSDPNHFSNKKIWQRASILLAGVTMNIILAGFLISLGFMIGLPQNVDETDSNAILKDKKIQIVEVIKDSPAYIAELKAGDVISKIEGNAFESADKLQEYTDERTGEELNYTIIRAEEVLEKKMTPELMDESGKGGIGVGIVETAMVKYPFHLAIWNGFKTTFMLTWLIIVAFYELLKNILIGNGVNGQVAGPVGIAVLTGQVARMGFVYILQFTAMLSINLAIINAFPFPALDGGRVIFLIIEKIKGSPIKKEVEGLIHYMGFALLMVLIVVVTFKDISKYTNIFHTAWEKIIG